MDIDSDESERWEDFFGNFIHILYFIFISLILNAYSCNYNDDI